jgi:hypothetical protein
MEEPEPDIVSTNPQDHVSAFWDMYGVFQHGVLQLGFWVKMLVRSGWWLKGVIVLIACAGKGMASEDIKGMAVLRPN